MEFVTYGGEKPQGCPEAIWDDLCRVGLPRVGLNIFTPSPGPAPGSAEVDGIVLGCSRENVELYVEFVSGNVCLRWPQESGPAVVNSSLGAFRESLLEMDVRYPFYPADRDLDMAWEAAEELRRILVRIDSVATADPDGYWSSFLDDVAVGDYAADAGGDDAVTGYRGDHDR
ncbi:SUKH-4 family immunity protein [Actinoplanes sp. NPDC023936]|uniref:SUKH-4 family immunity protein n=1 Tax=Actinoplanes sp. NPDC023936 TaxID=3154910 RepID=UPI0033D38944